MAEDNNVQKIKRWKPTYKRPIWRPKTRWEDDVLEDVRSMNVRNWKKVAQDRDSWKKAVEQARTLMYVWPCIIYENDDRGQLDATVMIYYHKYLYRFRASIWPSSGVQVVCCCIWFSALGVVAVVLRSRCVFLCTVCNFVSSRIQTHTLCARLHTGS